MLLRGIHGAGTSLGYRAASMLATLAALGTMGPLGASAVGGALGGGLEALSESGMSLSDNYATDKDRFNDALKAANYQFLVNAPTDMAIEAIENRFSPVVNPNGKFLSDWLKSLAINEASEITQETKQNIIGSAANRTFEDKDATLEQFLRNLGSELGNAPEHFAQVAPEIAVSTAITEGILGLMGLAGGANNRNSTNETIQSAENNEDEELLKLKDDWSTSMEQLRNSTSEEEQDKILIRISNLENAIKNFGKDAEQVQAEKQAEAVNTATAPEIQPTQETLPDLPHELVDALNEESNRLQEEFDKKSMNPLTYLNPFWQQDLGGINEQIRNIDQIIKNKDLASATSLNEQIQKDKIAREQEKAAKVQSSQTQKPIQEELAEIKPVSSELPVELIITLKREIDRLQEEVDKQLVNPFNLNDPNRQIEMGENIAQMRSLSQILNNNDLEAAKSLYEAIRKANNAREQERLAKERARQLQNPVQEENTFVTPFVEERKPLSDTILNLLQEENNSIQETIDKKLLSQNGQEERDELTGLFTRQRRIDNAIKNGDTAEANRILEEKENLEKTGVAFDIYTADISQLQEERDRLEALYEEELKKQFTPKSQEKLYNLNSSINAIDEVIQSRSNQSENTSNTPSMDDLWGMVESNEDTDEYNNDDHDEDNAVSENIKQEQVEEDLRFDFKYKLYQVTQDEELSEGLSRIYIAGNKFFAKYTGRSLEEIISAENLRFEAHDRLLIRDKSGNIVDEAKAQTDITESELLIKVSKLADQSSILHEMGHLFLYKFQALARAGLLKGLAKHDWNTLLKSYGIEGIDFENMSESDKEAWTNTHEKFATDLERYFMTGEAPNAKLKHVFEQFKRWLTEIYESIKNITYTGSDGERHKFELSPEIKEILDHMLGDSEELGIRNEAKSYNQTVNANNNETYNQALTGEEKENIHDKLKSAQEMIDMKIPPKFIKMATGWEKISEDEWHWHGKNSAQQDAHVAYFSQGNEHRKSKDALSQALLTYNNKGLKAIFGSGSK